MLATRTPSATLPLLQVVLGTESGMITSIVRKVQQMLRDSGRKDVEVEIVFPVSSQAITTSGQVGNLRDCYLIPRQRMFCLRLLSHQHNVLKVLQSLHNVRQLQPWRLTVWRADYRRPAVAAVVLSCCQAACLSSQGRRQGRAVLLRVAAPHALT